MKIDEIEIKAQEALASCLKEIPFIQLKKLENESLSERRINFIIEVKIQGMRKLMLGEVKSSGQPRLARNAVNQLIRYREELPDSYGIFVAPYISKSAAEICKRDGIGYLDLAGNCFISFDNIFISREGQPNPFPERRELQSLYYPKAERILRVLLEKGSKLWKTQELADEADVSLGLVAKVKQLLDDSEWIESEAVGFELQNPFQLLENWAENYDFGRNEVKYFYSLLSPTELEQSLIEICSEESLRYAFTGFSAAARLAPMVRYQKVTMYLGDEKNIDLIKSSLEIRPVPSGANLHILIPYDEGVFYNTNGDREENIVSATQTYLDLIYERGRGEEAAEAILQSVIRRKWQ